MMLNSQDPEKYMLSITGGLSWTSLAGIMERALFCSLTPVTPLLWTEYRDPSCDGSPSPLVWTEKLSPFLGRTWVFLITRDISYSPCFIQLENTPHSLSKRKIFHCAMFLQMKDTDLTYAQLPFHFWHSSSKTPRLSSRAKLRLCIPRLLFDGCWRIFTCLSTNSTRSSKTPLQWILYCRLHTFFNLSLSL